MDSTNQIKRMIKFMEQEATEKANEIEAKAEEEYNIFLGQSVQTERQKINHKFQKLEASVEKQRMVFQSKGVNNARLQMFRLKESIMEDVFTTAAELVVSKITNIDEYRSFMKLLILQGACKLTAPRVLVRVRECDVDIAKEVLADASKEYIKLTNISVVLNVDTKNFLPNSVIGGADMYDTRGKCKVSNTLKYRLTLIRSMLMPVIRHYLFGPNNRRQFYDKQY